MKREGAIVRGYLSPDGTNWTLRSSVTLSNLASTVYVGLALTSHLDGTLATAVFNNPAIVTPGGGTTVHDCAISPAERACHGELADERRPDVECVDGYRRLGSRRLSDLPRYAQLDAARDREHDELHGYDRCSEYVVHLHGCRA